MRRIVLTPAGSAGDVNPFVGLGAELRRRGHDVVVATAEPFRATVESAGLEFVPVLSRERWESALADPDLWHPLHGPRALFRLLDRESLERAWAVLERLHRPGRTTLVGHMLSFPTRAFEEVHGVPSATVQLAPIAFRTGHLQPVVPPGLDPGRLPPPLPRLLWWAGDRVGVEPHVRRTLHPFLRAHGLVPPRRLFESWVHSPRRVIGFFPEWFAPRQPDWPAALRLVGFPLFDGFAEPHLSPALERWLAEGPPPVVVAPGSANRQAGALFRAVARATARAGLRALFVTPWADPLPTPLPEHVRHEPAVSFRTLFPRCGVIVHHGGIGTTAQSLAAGRPQLVVGRAFDQPDNGTRVERLGVGRRVDPRRSRRLGRALEEIASDAGMAERARRIAARMAEAPGALARAADEVEALGSDPSARR